MFSNCDFQVFLCVFVRIYFSFFLLYLFSGNKEYFDEAQGVTLVSFQKFDELPKYLFFYEWIWKNNGHLLDAIYEFRNICSAAKITIEINFSIYFHKIETTLCYALVIRVAFIRNENDNLTSLQRLD